MCASLLSAAHTCLFNAYREERKEKEKLKIEREIRIRGHLSFPFKFSFTLFLLNLYYYTLTHIILFISLYIFITLSSPPPLFLICSSKPYQRTTRENKKKPLWFKNKSSTGTSLVWRPFGFGLVWFGNWCLFVFVLGVGGLVFHKNGHSSAVVFGESRLSVVRLTGLDHGQCLWWCWWFQSLRFQCPETTVATTTYATGT